MDAQRINRIKGSRERSRLEVQGTGELGSLIGAISDPSSIEPLKNPFRVRREATSVSSAVRLLSELAP